MIESGSLEYAHARLCARFGARPDELAWRRIEMIRDIAGALDAVRASPLAAWVGDIGPDADVHAIERALRAHLRHRIGALADWMPPRWRTSLEWCAMGADLPLLQHLARGGAPPAWLRDDPLGAALRSEAPAGDAGWLLREARRDPDRVGMRWRAEWQRRLPVPLARSPGLAELAQLLAAHAAAFANPQVVEGWTLRRALHGQLVQRFRRAALTPAAAFIFVALSALDAERLRGELARRVVFPRLPLAA